jgi:hypothetical protein
VGLEHQCKGTANFAPLCLEKDWVQVAFLAQKRCHSLGPMTTRVIPNRLYKARIAPRCRSGYLDNRTGPEAAVGQ